MKLVESVQFDQPGVTRPTVSKGSAAEAQKSFAEALGNALETVNASQQNVDRMVTNVANGSSSEDLHNIMIAAQEANLLLRTSVQVRDRVIGAYQEIMRMQV